jgi:hypothetical protein
LLHQASIYQHHGWHVTENLSSPRPTCEQNGVDHRRFGES